MTFAGAPWSLVPALGSSAIPLETLMKLGYQQATISFCVDLTSPNSDIIPIANLLIGEAEGRQVAGLRSSSRIISIR